MSSVNMTNIAFIHGCFPAGGAERVTIDIAEYLHKINGDYRVFVYTSYISDDLLTDSIQKLLTIRQVPANRKLKSKEVEDWIKKDKIDIVVQVATHLHGIAEIQKRTGCKVILANHGEPFWQRHSIIYKRQRTPFKRFLWKVINKMIYVDFGRALKVAVRRSFREYKRCDAYTVLCDKYKQQTEKMFGIKSENSHVFAIENAERPVNDVSFNKENIILFCGRLDSWSKRVDRLLRIWEKVQDNLPEWQLFIVGDGPERGNLEAQAKNASLKRIHFEGSKSNVESYYRRASIVCLTSETEGWPLAMTEAQAHGCIPIAFNCTAGVEDILGPDGENGFLVTPYNEDEYSKKLVEIAKMSDEAKMAIRKNAVAKRLRYTPDIISAKWKALFDTIAKA